MPLLHRSAGWQRQRSQIETHSAPQAVLTSSSGKLVPRDIESYTPRGRCFDGHTSEAAEFNACTPRVTDFFNPIILNMPVAKNANAVPPSPTYSLFPGKTRCQPPDRPLPTLPRRLPPAKWPKRHSSHVLSSDPTKNSPAQPRLESRVPIAPEFSSSFSNTSTASSSDSSSSLPFSPSRSPSPSPSSRSPSSPRPDSITIPAPLSPFYAIVTTPSHVQYWISAEEALGRGRKPGDMPEEEWERLKDLAREVLLVKSGKNGRGRAGERRSVEWVQLIRGSYEVLREDG